VQLIKNAPNQTIEID
jgi:hypothetical protein